MIERKHIAALVVSASCLVGIATHEAYRGTAYLDSGKVATLGYGETKGVKMGDKTTPDRALVQLLASVNEHADGIRECITVPLYPHEFEAYSSFAFNVGVGAFCQSTLIKLLNESRYDEACKQILRWNKVNGKVIRGLTIRRESEYRTCIGQQ